jgi:hypothetical protein
MKHAVALAIAAALPACGGSTKAPPPVAHVEAPPPDDHAAAEDGDGDDDLEVVSTRGHVDPTVVEAGLSAHAAELETCYTGQVGRRRWLGGKVELKWQVSADGAVQSVQLASSDLGAWPVERCLLGVARAMTFGRPKGGAADFSIPLEFSARGAVTWWDADAGLAAVKTHVADLARCEKTSPAPADAVVTAYVGTRGKVQSVGFSTAAATGLDPDTWDAWAECAEKRILAWQLPDPRGSIAKLAFHYP